MDGLRGRIKPLGWRQGSILPSELTARILDERGLGVQRELATLVVLMQDCDLLADRLEQEPFVELILGAGPVLPKRTLDRSNRQAIIGVRGIEAADRTSFLTFRDHDRFRVPREWLLEQRPHPTRSLSHGELLRLLAMIVRRFRRPALADAFNDRLAPVFGSGKPGFKLLRSHHHLFRELRWCVPAIMDDLGAGTDYRVDALVAVLEPGTDPAEAEEVLENLQELIRAHCPGIDMGKDANGENRFTLWSPEEVTLAEYDSLLERSEPWDWEWLSRPSDIDTEGEAP